MFYCSVGLSTSPTLTFSAFAQCQIPEVPEQPDASRPHHQVTASPAQEEETAQYQCSVSGETHTDTCTAESVVIECSHYKNNKISIGRPEKSSSSC